VKLLISFFSGKDKALQREGFKHFICLMWLLIKEKKKGLFCKWPQISGFLEENRTAKREMKKLCSIFCKQTQLP
jgi:hypothetical protein